MTAAERQARRRARVKKSMNRRRRTLYQLKKTAPARERREALRNATPVPDGLELRIGDARVVLADIPDNSVAAIITDPPYGNQAEPLYRWLAEFAARVLVHGGSLICLTGQARLDRDMQIFGEHLNYLWLRAMMHNTHQRLHGARVICGYKPLLHYTKGRLRKMDRSPLIPDVLYTAGRDKSAHEWGQGTGGVSVFIEHLTDPGETIIDPFAGTATWGNIAHSMGRRWIGADIAKGGSATIVAEMEAEQAPWQPIEKDEAA
jgi:DNA methylase